jgi:hypothetical protein
MKFINDIEEFGLWFKRLLRWDKCEFCENIDYEIKLYDLKILDYVQISSEVEITCNRCGKIKKWNTDKLYSYYQSLKLNRNVEAENGRCS